MAVARECVHAGFPRDASKYMASPRERRVRTILHHQARHILLEPVTLRLPRSSAVRRPARLCGELLLAHALRRASRIRRRPCAGASLLRRPLNHDDLPARHHLETVRGSRASPSAATMPGWTTKRNDTTPFLLDLPWGLRSLAVLRELGGWACFVSVRCSVAAKCN